MARPVFAIEGARQLRASLRELDADMQDFKGVHAKVGGYVGAESAQRVPSRTGTLAATWRPGAAATNVTVRFGGAAAPYANAVHWGTGARAGKKGPHNIRPSLFAVTAAHDTEPTWVPWYLEELNRMVARVRGA